MAGNGATTQEGLLQIVMALIRDTKCSSHMALPAITTDHVLHTPGLPLGLRCPGWSALASLSRLDSMIEVVHVIGIFLLHPVRLQHNTIIALGELIHLPAITQLDIFTRSYMARQKLLDIHLVGAMYRLEVLMRPGGSNHAAYFFPFGRHVDPRQLMAVVAGEVGNIGLMLRG